MKVIDLLNKIANGEEVPKKIYFWDREYELDEYRHYMTYYESTNLYDDMFDKCENGELEDFLNDEVEIIEEEICHKCHKYPAEYNQTYCEFCLGISKLEEKKIPDKLKKKKVIDGSFEGKITYIYKYNEYEIGETINEIIDYLKSKGE